MPTLCLTQTPHSHSDAYGRDGVYAEYFRTYGFRTPLDKEFGEVPFFFFFLTPLACQEISRLYHIGKEEGTSLTAQVSQSIQKHSI